MPISFKEAVRKMSNDPNLKYFYFFCEKGEDGKPVMLADTKKLDPKKPGPAQKALSAAQAKGNSAGTMRVSDKVLNLKPQGSGLAAAKLKTGVKLAATQAQVKVLEVNVGEPEPERKEHADPLRADPAMARLLDKKQELEDKIAEVVGNDDSAELDATRQQAVDKLRAELEKIDEDLETAQKQLNKRGIAAKGLHEQYKDENKKYGWRTDKEEPKPRSAFQSDQEHEQYLQKREQLRETDLRTTKMFTEQEKDNAAVRFDAEGRAVGKPTEQDDGTVTGENDILRDKKKAEYVVDKNGTMRQFANKTKKTGEMMVNPETGKEEEKDVATHHSSVMSGAEVAGAGEMDINYQGYITRISNKSGHYKPSATQMIQILEDLAKKGALLEKSYLMPGPDGKGAPLDGKAKEIYAAVAKVEARVSAKMEVGGDVEQELLAIKQGKNTLAKLGAAPANKFRFVQVEFLDGADKKKGAEVAYGKGEVSTAEDFLASGAGATTKGGKKVRDVKKGVLNELKASPNFQQATKDGDVSAQNIADHVAHVVKKQFAELPKVLKWYQEELVKAKAAPDRTEKGRDYKVLLLNGIERIQKALKPTEFSEEGLTKVLEALKAQYIEDKAQLEEVGPMPEHFGATTLDYTKYKPELVAQRLGITLAELKSCEGDGQLFPEDLLKNSSLKAKIGVDSVDDLYLLINGKQPQPKPAAAESQPNAAAAQQPAPSGQQPAPSGQPVQQAAAAEEADEPMPADWAGAPLTVNEDLAKRLGVPLDELKAAGTYGGGDTTLPATLMNIKARLGVGSLEELHRKLKSKPAAPPPPPPPPPPQPAAPQAKPMPADWASANLTVNEDLAKRLGVPLDELKAAGTYGGGDTTLPATLMNIKARLGVSSLEELYQKVAGE